MQTNATRDLLTKGSSSWQWDVTGGQSSLHLTSQIKMLNCNPLLKILKAKCTLTDIKYTPLSDNKTSPVTREVATSPTENWQLSLFALPRVLIFYFNEVSHLTIYLMFLYSELWLECGDTYSEVGADRQLWGRTQLFFQVMERNSLQHYHHQMIIQWADNPHVMSEDKYRQRWTKCLTNWREHSSHIFKFRHSSRSATPFPLFRLLGR